MNSLSWLLYAAGIFENLGPVLGIISAALVLGYTAVFIVKTVNANDFDGEWPKFVLRYYVVGAIFALVACLVPSAKTVYMIAASEAGARVAETSAAKEVLDLLRSKLREALAENKKS